MSSNSTETEVTSLDTGLRMEAWLALTLWDVVNYVLEPLASWSEIPTPQTTLETIDHVINTD